MFDGARRFLHVFEQRQRIVGRIVGSRRQRCGQFGAQVANGRAAGRTDAARHGRGSDEIRRHRSLERRRRRSRLRMLLLLQLMVRLRRQRRLRNAVRAEGKVLLHARMIGKVQGRCPHSGSVGLEKVLLLLRRRRRLLLLLQH